MKRISALFILICAVCFAAMAKDAPAYPTAYSAKQTALATNPASACNKGGESFISFIKQFKASPKFRKARTRIGGYEYSMEGEYAGYIIADFKGKTGKRRSGGEAWFGTYFNVSANSVWYYEQSEPTSDDAEWGGGMIMFGFERIAGKWYVVFVQAAG